jgi:N-acetylglucosaminyldiphosphoundecaprenol N-acetyl-beta-D-mannosaminyltransferase
MPMVWVGRAYGHEQMERVYGPDLMVSVCGQSVGWGLKHFFCGGAPGVCGELASKLTQRFPGIQVVGTWTPPFRALTNEERNQLAEKVKQSRADFLWVGLSTPKQERFMHEMHALLPDVVMLGVGAAFDMNAGLLKQAPKLLQRLGLEWAYRLYREPRRLWRRYLRNNPSFLFNIVKQLASQDMEPL